MKTLKIIFFSMSIVVFCLFIVLIVHIAKAPRLKVDHSTWQLSTVIFDEPLDENQMKMIRSILRNKEGVKKEHFRPEQGLVLFYHDQLQVKAIEVYEHLKTRLPYSLKLYQSPAEASNQRVCPAMEPDSYKYQFSVFVQELFY
ncbi:MAG: hypothetical protein ACK4RM_06160 [Flavobacterium sp.]